MLEQSKGVVGHAHHPRDIFGGDLKWFGAQYDRPFAALFEGDAVMQTAR